MKRIFVVLLLITVILGCDKDDNLIKITEKTKIRKLDGSGIEYKVNERYVPASTETLVLKYEMGHNVEIIEGVEQLKKLKNLYIGYGLLDFRFLEEMKSVKILWIERFLFDDGINLGFLNKLPKLQILIINQIVLANTIIDFSKNRKLEYTQLNNLHFPMEIRKEQSNVTLSVRNVPKSLEFLDMSMNIEPKITDEFLKSLESIPFVAIPDDELLGENKPSKEYLNGHANFLYGYRMSNSMREKYGYKKIREIFNLD
ncbi:MAG: hypothetical protein JW874_10805 [Spirochaetales bacterium]|nr:hypothetical protein [Spirochaetales bacterium]